MRYGEKSCDREAHNEACETDTAVRVDRGRWRWSGWKHTLVSHLWILIWGLLPGDAIVLHFRALILYTCYCARQTAKDTALLASVEQMIRKEKEGKENN